MSEPVPPAGYASWDEVPDDLIPSESAGLMEGANRPRSRCSFVKGPVYVDWIAAVSRCGPPKTLRVALALKAHADMRKSPWMSPPYAILRTLDVSATDLSRCLSA